MRRTKIMKIYERPTLNISKFDENIATSESMIDPQTAYGQAQTDALAAVGGNENNMFRVRIAF